MLLIHSFIPQQEHAQIFPPSLACALSFDFTSERDRKNIFYYQRDAENYTDQFRNVSVMNIYPRNLLVCNSGQHTYATGLFGFFFVLQDLIDRIDFISRVAFQRNLLLIGF